MQCCYTNNAIEPNSKQLNQYKSSMLELQDTSHYHIATNDILKLYKSLKEKIFRKEKVQSNQEIVDL